MKLSYLPVIAALAAPSVVEGYFSSSPLSFFSSPLIPYGPSSMMRRHRALANQFRNLPRSPHFEIDETDEAFHLAVDVPGVEPEDINLSVENDVLTLSGERRVTDRGSSFASEFYQSFRLGPVIEADDITAELKNGVLYVTAPKNLQKIEENVRKIPVKMATETPYRYPLNRQHDAIDVETSHEPQQAHVDPYERADEEYY